MAEEGNVKEVEYVTLRARQERNPLNGPIKSNEYCNSPLNKKDKPDHRPND
jgi:hypothetical protein